MSEIDVSKCEHYNDGICDKYYDIECSDHPECMNKQLQRLKQENEELKSKLALFSDVDYTYESTELENSLGLANKYVNKYKQCLDEIEEVVKNGVKDSCGMPLDELSIILKIIKQTKEGWIDGNKQ